MQEHAVLKTHKQATQTFNMYVEDAQKRQQTTIQHMNIHYVAHNRNQKKHATHKRTTDKRTTDKSTTNKCATNMRNKQTHNKQNAQQTKRTTNKMCNKQNAQQTTHSKPNAQQTTHSKHNVQQTHNKYWHSTPIYNT